MKRFLRGFSGTVFAALVIRLVLAPFAFHSDLTTNTIWGIYAKEFGLRGYYDWLSFGNYARPEYPPLSTLLFMCIRYLWQGIFNFLWFLNVNIPVFPSNLVTWFDNYGNLFLLKFPGILGDIGIGYLIYKFTKSKILASFYLFNPAVIYLSSVWGQTESFVGFFALLSLTFLIQKKYLKSALSFFISFMTKATMLPVVAVAAVVAIKNKIKLGQTAAVLAILFVSLNVIGYLFTDHAYISWIISSYFSKFIIGPYNLGYLNLNAFNFWGLITGFERIPVALYLLPAWIISLVFLGIILYKLYRRGNIFFACLLTFFASFLFLPKMHERYMYPVFIFFPFVLAKFPGLKKVFYLSSFIFLVNLYHWWWVPYIPGLVSFFDLELVERGLSLVNLGAFGYLIWKYRSS